MFKCTSEARVKMRCCIVMILYYLNVPYLFVKLNIFFASVKSNIMLIYFAHILLAAK
jgi:hypothetical protein